MRVLGLDGCRDGWVVVEADDHGWVGASVARTAARALDLASASGAVDAVVVDIPIGVPISGSRKADTLARKFIKPRGSSVFPTPIRAALDSKTYDDARAASLAVHGKSLSKQAWAISDKIRDIDEWAPTATVPVREGHPEVSFRAMAGAPIGHYKKTQPGAMLRWELLRENGIAVPCDLDLRALPSAARDDVYDAAAMAWTALRVARGEAVSIPDTPEDMGGWRAAIWY